MIEILVKDIPNKFIVPQQYKIIIIDNEYHRLLAEYFKDFYDRIFMENNEANKILFNSVVKNISIDYDKQIILVMVY